jgi:hypothetical protein
MPEKPADTADNKMPSGRTIPRIPQKETDTAGIPRKSPAVAKEEVEEDDRFQATDN